MIKKGKQHLCLLIIYSLAGLVVSWNLLQEHYDHSGEGICEISERISCSLLNQSSYSELFNVPVALLGMCWNLVLLGASFASFRLLSPHLIDPLLLSSYLLAIFLWTIAGIIMVGYFVYAEIVLGAICPFCTVVHILSILSMYSSTQLFHCLRFSWRENASPTNNNSAQSERKQSAREFLSDSYFSLDRLKNNTRFVRHIFVWMLIFFLLFALPLIIFNLVSVDFSSQGENISSTLSSSSSSSSSQNDGTESGAPTKAMLDRFAKCLSAHGFVMYGSMKCSHCQHQKQLFGPSFRHITFVECSEQCTKEYNILGFPTWIQYQQESHHHTHHHHSQSPQEEIYRHSGVIQLDTLSNLSNHPCTLHQE